MLLAVAGTALMEDYSPRIMVGSHRLVEFIWGYLGEYLEISVMSAVRRGPRDDFGEFCQIVAILG